MYAFNLVPEEAPQVTIRDMLDSSSLFISWTAIPEEQVTGRLLGYHVMYKPIKQADKQMDRKSESRTVTIDSPDRLYMTLDGLSSYTVYSICVAGFTAKGGGKKASHVIGGDYYNYSLGCNSYSCLKPRCC